MRSRKGFHGCKILGSQCVFKSFLIYKADELIQVWIIVPICIDFFFTQPRAKAGTKAMVTIGTRATVPRAVTEAMVDTEATTMAQATMVDMEAAAALMITVSTQILGMHQ